MPYRYGSGTGGAGSTPQSTIDLISTKLRSFFPGIHFEVDHAWSGVLGVTRDWNGGVHWDQASGIGSSTGYAGHGVTAAYVGGRTLAELAFETKNRTDHTPLGRLPLTEVGTRTHPLARCPRHVPALRTC